MATPRLTLVDVYTDLQCAGGTAIAPILDLERAEEFREIMGEDRLELALPRESAAWASLQERRVIRCGFSDGTFDEWRVSELTESREEDGALRSRVVCLSPDVDLAAHTPIGRTEADGRVVYTFEALSLTVSQHLSTFILPALSAAGATWYAAGAIDPTAPVDLVYDWTTPRQACLQLAEALRVEFRLRRNGTTQYLLDFLTQIGGATDPAGTIPRLHVQMGMNLRGVQRRRSAVEQAIRVYGRGTPEEGLYPTIAEALWKVTSVPSTTRAQLADPNGGDGPLLENDQLNARYVRKWPSGSWVLINDSALASHEITTAAVHGLAVNDLVQFAADASGTALTSLHSPAYAAAYVPTGPLPHKILDKPDLPGTVNLLTNPAMRAYAGASNAAPDGWGVIPGCGLSVNNVDKETTAGRWRVGGAAAKVVAGGDGQGIETGYAAIVPTDGLPYFSGFMGLWNDTDGGKVRVDLVAGKATVSISSMSRATAGGITTVTVNTGSAHGAAIGDRIEILGTTGATTADGYNGIKTVSRVVDTDTLEYQLTSDPGAITLSSATMRPVWVFSTPGNAASKTWLDLGWHNEDLKKLAATVLKVRVMQDGSTGVTLYVDCAQATQGKGEGQRPFIEGSGPTQLWQAVNRYLADFAPPQLSYDVNLVDLARLDPVLWPSIFADIILGSPVDIDDQEWGLDASTRLVGRQRVLRASDGDDGVTHVTLSSRPGDIFDETVKPARGPRRPAPKPTGRRVRRTVILSGASFKGITSTDASRLQSNFGGGFQGIVCTPFGVTGVCSKGLGDDLLSLGAKILAMRVFSDETNPGAPGSAIFRLYRDDTVIAEVATIGQGHSDTTIDEVIQSAPYQAWASLTTSGTSQVWLDRMEIDIEVDE